MRKRLLAGNWKMNKTEAELPAFFENFAKECGLSRNRPDDGVEIMFCVPSTLMKTAAALGREYGIRVAAQNIHWEKSGAFTGEISIDMIKEQGVTATLIGHSERRQYFAETDETVAKKTKACVAAGVLPVICVGETRAEREGGKTAEVVGRQVKAVLEVLDANAPFVIAYEPVWAIGTGLNATNAQAQEVHGWIRGMLREKFGADRAEGVQILYGGSANPANIDGLLTEKDIDGGLVGGASLKPADFAKMVIAGRTKRDGISR